MQQRRLVLSNEVLIGGYVGKVAHPLTLTAGAGNEINTFSTNYAIGTISSSIIDNFISGDIMKDTRSSKGWTYHASAKLYLTGRDAGNFSLKGDVSTFLNDRYTFRGVYSQVLHSAPYSWTTYANRYYSFSNSFPNESIIKLSGELLAIPSSIYLTLTDYLISNYLYLNKSALPDQYTGTFNIVQGRIHKDFYFGSNRHFVFRNDIATQQTIGSAPVHLPVLIARQSLSLEKYLFNNKLKIATGLEVRYNTPYYGDNYSPLFNRFFEQTTDLISNVPIVGTYFNFKIKNFRAYFMLDQIQQLFTSNNVAALHYPEQNFMIRFGFSWAMVN